MGLQKRIMEEDLQKLAELISAREKLIKDVINHCVDICSRYCPVSVGDIVKVTGYAFNGKFMEVDYITFKKHWLKEKHCFFATGKLLKVDGKPGLQNGEWESDMYEIKTPLDNEAERG